MAQFQDWKVGLLPRLLNWASLKQNLEQFLESPSNGLLSLKFDLNSLASPSLTFIYVWAQECVLNGVENEWVEAKKVPYVGLPKDK